MPKPTDSQIAAVPIFGRLSPEDRALIADVAEVRSYQPGAKVFTKAQITKSPDRSPDLQITRLIIRSPDHEITRFAI